MNAEVFGMIALGLQTVVIIALVVWTARLLVPGRLSELVVFTAFGLSSFLLSNLYWIAWTLLEHETRMPFAVNEIGECAAALLLAAAMRTQLSDLLRGRLAEILLPAAFAACNVALWIGWSGEWVEDAVSGLALGYYLIVATRLLRQDQALSGPEWIGLGAVSALLMLLQGLTFFTPARVAATLDACCYGAMIVSTALFLLRAVRAARRGEQTALPLAFACHGWITVCLYMSAGAPYTLLSLCVTANLPLMVLGVKGRVMSA